MAIFIIDCEEKPGRIINRFQRLKTTISIENHGEYQFYGSTGYYKVLLETSLNEQEVEKILCNGNYDYVGIVEKTTPEHCSASSCHDKCMFHKKCSDYSHS